MASSAKKNISKTTVKSKPASKSSAKATKPAKKSAGSAAKKPSAAGKSPKANGARKEFGAENVAHELLATKNNKQQKRLDPFVRGQKDKLLQLRDAMVDSMAGVAKYNLRSRAEGS